MCGIVGAFEEDVVDDGLITDAAADGFFVRPTEDRRMKAD